MASSTFHKGQDVWYKTKDGTYVEAKVASVDLSIRPVSYGIYLDGSDNLRETESPRLENRAAGQPPPYIAPDDFSNGNGQGRAVPGREGEEAEKRDSGKKGKENGSNNLDVDYNAMRRRPHTRAAAFKSPGPPHHLQKPGSKLNSVKTAFRPPLEDEDAFGDFSGAEVLPEDRQFRDAPIPLSAFGEADNEDDAAEPEATTSQNDAWNLYPQGHISQGPRQSLMPQFQGIAQSYPQVLQPLPPEDRGMPLQSLSPAIASQLFPARDIFKGMSQDLQELRKEDVGRADHVIASSLKGVSPKSAAAQSDDFGEFEEAELEPPDAPMKMEMHSGHFQQSNSAQPADKKQQADSIKALPVDLQHSLALKPTGPHSEQHQASRAVGGKGTQIARKFEQEEGNDDEEEEEEEIPWYMDPDSYTLPHRRQAEQSGQTHPEASLLAERDLLQQGKHGNELDQQQTWNNVESMYRHYVNPSLQGVHLQEDRPQQPSPAHTHSLWKEQMASDEPPKFGVSAEPHHWTDIPAAAAAVQPVPPRQMHSRNQEWQIENYGPATASLPLPLLQTMERMPASPPQGAGHIHSGLTVPSQILVEAGETQPQRQAQSQAFGADDYTRQQQEKQMRQAEASKILHLQAQQRLPAQAFVPAASACSYSEAWTQMIEVCAAELERGYAILQQEAHLPSHLQRLAGTRGKDYLRALGQLYLSSLLLQAAMEMHVQQQHRPVAFQEHAHRCSRAWSKGLEGDSLEEAVFRVAPQMPRHVQHLPRQISSALSEAPRWHELRQQSERQWEDGLCGISLLPLDQLQELHVTNWADDRPCLVLLANLWSNKVSSKAPRLQGWAM